MRQRDATRAAQRFIREKYPGLAHMEFDICYEHTTGRAKAWSFGLTPDQEHPDYKAGVHHVGYVHADGTLEGLY